MKATLTHPEIVIRDGKPTAVILDLDVYEALLERLEDDEDLQWLRKIRRKPQHFRKFEEFLKEYSSCA